MKTFNAFVIISLGFLALSATSAAGKPRKKANRNIETVALSKSDSPSGDGALSMGKSSPSTSSDSNFSAKLLTGLVTGFPVIEGNPIVLGIDGQYRITPSFFALLGYSNWAGSGDITVIKKRNGVVTDSDTYTFNMATTTIDTGAGYRWRVASKGNIDLGSRIGWLQINQEVKDYSGSIEGYNIAPFVGFSWMIVSRLSVGLEERVVIPIISSEDKEDDPDTEVESKGGGVPLYTLLNLGYAF